MTVTLGVLGNLGSSGWTTIAPSVDSTLVYVAAAGSDSNPGTAASPVRTLAHALSLTRNNYPDWIVLNEGDTWTGDVNTSSGLFGNGYLSRQGRSADEPFVICSGNLASATTGNPRGNLTGNRPVLQAWSSWDGASINGTVIAGPLAYTALMGLEVYGYKQDQSNAAYNAALSPVTAVSATQGTTQWTLIEGCRFKAIGSAVQYVPGNFIFRRNAIDIAPALGLYLEAIINCLIEENTFYHCGWPIGGTQSTFNHNVYGQWNNSTYPSTPQSWIYRGNASLWSSNTGLRMRHCGQIYANLLSSNQTGFEYGDAGVAPGNVAIPISATDNVIVGTLYTGASTGGSGDQLLTAATSPYPTITLRRNLAANHDSSGSTLANFSAPSNCNVDLDGSNYAINAGVTSYISSTGNTIAGPNTSSAGMPDATRSVARYATEIASVANEATLIEAMLSNSQGSFDAAYYPNTIANWIRAGFNMPLVVFLAANHGGRGLGRF